MKTEQDLAELERSLEEDVREARRQLDLGRREAIAELEHHRETLGTAFQRTAEALGEIADDASAQLDGLQKKLGELNLLLAEGTVDDLETFETLRGELVQQMEETLDALRRIEVEDGLVWEDERQALQDAWAQFRTRLELVRFHLGEDAQQLGREFEENRRQLADELARLEEKARLEKRPLREFLDDLQKGYDHLKPWLKSLLMVRGERSP